jgi:ATP-dependent Clp protease protease subunit
MKPTLITLAGFALATTLSAQEAVRKADANSNPVEQATETPAASETSVDDSAESEEQTDAGTETETSARKILEEEQAELALQNSLVDERVKHETAGMRAEIARLNAEKALIEARLAHAAAKRRADEEAQSAKLEIEKERLAREAEVAEMRAKVLGNQLKAVQAESGIEITELQNQIQRLEIAEKRKGYADSEPEYLENPLRDDGVLVISDRRIALNGPITATTADEVTNRIHYYNNQNAEHPIFIVIDSSPGGSVMAGYRILKAMEASDAPVHVVVKSFAASMAAAITTLAEESYAYPNAMMLHHEISSTVFGRMNLTQQEEFLKETQRWWDRFGTPLAKKMGITKEEFVRQMYENSLSGDWNEFAEEAQKLNWVKHIVSGIEETSFRRDPNAADADSSSKSAAQLESGLDEDGRPVMYLPRINPKDVYFLYNPDNYYRMR